MSDELKTIRNNGYTVKELINSLSVYPEDAVVYLHKKGDKHSYLLTTITDCDLDIDGCITLTNELEYKKSIDISKTVFAKLLEEIILYDHNIEQLPKIIRELQRISDNIDIHITSTRIIIKTFGDEFSLNESIKDD